MHYVDPIYKQNGRALPATRIQTNSSLLQGPRSIQLLASRDAQNVVMADENSISRRGFSELQSGLHDVRTESTG